MHVKYQLKDIYIDCKMQHFSLFCFVFVIDLLTWLFDKNTSHNGTGETYISFQDVDVCACMCTVNIFKKKKKTVNWILPRDTGYKEKPTLHELLQEKSVNIKYKANRKR